MNLTTEQLQAIENGEAVHLEINGKLCVILQEEVYDRLTDEYDDDPVTAEEMNLLADELHEMISQNETDDY